MSGTGGAGPGGRERGREEGAWNPGLSSSIPGRLQPSVTLFDPANATREYAEARELADLSGLPEIELAVFRVERLIAHELLVRVTADFSVPDGPNYADLGISLRSMVATLRDRYVEPGIDALRSAFDAEMEHARAIVGGELGTRGLGIAVAEPDGAAAVAGTRTTGGPGAPGGPGEGGASESRRPGGERPEPSALSRLFGRWFGGGPARRSSGTSTPAHASAIPASVSAREPPESVAIAAWRAEIDAGDPDPLRRACLDALVRAVEAIVAHRGRLLAERATVGAIAVGFVVNARGAELIGNLLEPIVTRGAAAEGYRPLPVQERPVIMNVKGASASGKSTIRPRQRRLADSLGIAWEDFALISPDYWRKYLLDYESLGEDRRHGAMLCGQELEIVDRKLDRHMAGKAARGAMSHLLIDRFRFDSFTLEKDRTADSRLLTRFGHELYLFFMVTPPVETVERAWIRGQRTGRFKAVGDLLHHNVEAFTGMPALFLSWAGASDRRVHYEFLDNDVPEGTLPLTAAFGWNEAMTILDVSLMRDIDRYREIDVEARTPDAVHPAARDDAAGDPAFVRRCAERIGRIDFADRETAHVYARVERGRVVWVDDAHVDARKDAAEVRHVLASLGSGARPIGPRPGTAAPSPIDVAREAHFTVGRWASAVHDPDDSNATPARAPGAITGGV